MPYKAKSLTPALLKIIRDKGTEYPFTGIYDNYDALGTYLCRQCGLALYRSKAKFNPMCGWPSFDQEIADNVLRELDADEQRTEILCKRCHAHLGHVFRGEKLTVLDTRYCVNSASMDFVTDINVIDSEEAILAAGCFWGVEYYFKKFPGVLKVEVGYTGGRSNNPTYEEICQGSSGHFEAVRVLYDPAKISYEQIVKYFFEIHDPAQQDGQGPDLGEQYLSACFYHDERQKTIVLDLLNQLRQKGCNIASKVLPVSTFWLAENYHQDYYQKTGKHPYCHSYTKRF